MKKYMHIERLGTDEVEGIDIGECYVFAKLDGTNASVWLEDNELHGGSRSRDLTLDQDNFDFYKFVTDSIETKRFKEYFKKYPDRILYGEYLVPHTLKTYRTEAWRRFWIFDVLDVDRYISYEEYKQSLEDFSLDYIPPLCIINNPSIEQLRHEMDINTFLMKEGHIGEGIVIKNYEFYNKYGRQTWAKLVKNEFKEQNSKEFGVRSLEGQKHLEQHIVEKYCTEAFVEKTYAKIVADRGGWSSKMIPELLGRVFYDLVNENIWQAIKDFGMRSVDFKRLNQYCIKQIKDVKSELF